MGILGTLSNYQNCIKSTNNKIPPFATNYKKEYLYIRGLNKEFKYFYNHLDEINDGLFKSKRSDRIKYNMKRFLRGQERGKRKDISNLMLPRYDFYNIEEFYQNILYEFEFGDKPSYLEFFDLVGKIYNKIKIEFVFSDYYGEEYYI